MPAPTIETARLRLRAHTVDDFDAYAALWSDPVSVRFIGGAAFSREQSWQRMLRQAGMWSLVGYGFWAIEEQATGRFVGETGFLALKRELTPSLEDTMEVGWIIASDFHGKGYASEALAGALRWGDANFPDRRRTCMIETGNDASFRVAEKAGFRAFARANYHGAEVVLLER